MMSSLMKAIIKTYADYTLAYSKYVDKYNVNKSEDNAQEEIKVCDALYERLEMLVRATSQDEGMHTDLMNILSTTDKEFKIRMAENLKNFLDYLYQD